MRTSPGRALLPAAAVAFTAPILLLVSTLIAEAVQKQRVAGNFDAIQLWVVQGFAPLGPTGWIAGGATSGHQAGQMLAGYAVLAVVAFALTWLSAASLAPGSWSLPVVVGGWLGATLGAGLGGMVASAIAYRDFALSDGPGQAFFAHGSFLAGAGWGLIFGVLVGVVALLAWMVGRPRPSPTPYAGTVAEAGTDRTAGAGEQDSSRFGEDPRLG